jgi:hypothetical protein
MVKITSAKLAEINRRIKKHQSVLKRVRQLLDNYEKEGKIGKTKIGRKTTSTKKPKKVEVDFDQRKRVINSIRLVWSSLASHLDYAIENDEHSKIRGTKEFHTDCLKEYSFVIFTLTHSL